MPQDRSDYLGHRQRLRERLLSGGGKALADYELLEFLLCQAQPRGDMKPIAKLLIREFGGFAGVMAAAPDELRRIDGIGDASVAALKAVQESALRIAHHEIKGREVVGSWRKLLDYCRTALAAEKTEQFHLLFLDAKNAVIKDEAQSRGTINHTPVYAREVVKRALELGAAAIIMVHNHPSGDPTPSEDDIAMTREVAAAAAKLGIALHDHVIIAGGEHSSFRALGLL
jgi:DNA repair protein RadC